MMCVHLKDFKRGWVVGNFTPSLWMTNDFEVAIKSYQTGDTESAHYHELATEFTIIISGSFEINEHKVKAGDVVVISPNETASFKCLKSGNTTVIKVPCAADDKYIVGTT